VVAHLDDADQAVDAALQHVALPLVRRVGGGAFLLEGQDVRDALHVLVEHGPGALHGGQQPRAHVARLVHERVHVGVAVVLVRCRRCCRGRRRTPRATFIVAATHGVAEGVTLAENKRDLALRGLHCCAFDSVDLSILKKSANTKRDRPFQCVHLTSR
jgi:hypothetical protein